MRAGIISLLILLSGAVSAQETGRPELTQEQAQQVQAMQKCYKGLGQDTLKHMQANVEEMEAKIRQLCKQGRREDAEKFAMEWSKQLAQSDDMKQMNKCGEMGKKMMGELQKPATRPSSVKKTDICDSVKEEN